MEPIEFERLIKLHASVIHKCAEIMAASEPWKTLCQNKTEIAKSLKEKSNEIYLVTMRTEIIGLAVIRMKGPFSG